MSKSFSALLRPIHTASGQPHGDSVHRYPYSVLAIINVLEVLGIVKIYAFIAGLTKWSLRLSYYSSGGLFGSTALI